MAYVNGDIRVNIQGVNTVGEIWSNTWAVENAISEAQKTEAVARIHNFYNQIQGYLSIGWAAQVATVTDLFANVSTDEPFSDVSGTSTDFAMPFQVAIRVSLTAGVATKGGPFLTGWATEAVGAGGLIDDTLQILVADEVEDLAEELDGTGLGLALDSPTNSALLTVHTVRVGQRFDVIRKRANDQLEQYETRLVP